MVKELKVAVGDKVSEGDGRADARAPGTAPRRTETEPRAGRRRRRAGAAGRADADGLAARTHDEIYASPGRAPQGARGRDRPLRDQGLRPRRPHHDGGPRPRRAEAASAAPAAAPRRRASDRAGRAHPDQEDLRPAPDSSAWQTIPHVTQHDEADITDLEAFRKQINAEQDVKVTMVALLMKACVASLKAYPEVNSSLDGDDALLLKRYYNLGFAADTPQGLLVPVIKDVDHKGLLEVAAELRDLSGRARDGKLKSNEMQDGDVHDLVAGRHRRHVLHADHQPARRWRSSASRKSAMKPVWDGAQFVPRLMVPLSFSYDHRVIDGALAARFTAHLGERAGRPAEGAAVRGRSPGHRGLHDVPVIEVLVAEGDEVTEEQPLIMLESDKATMDVPSPAAGTITKLLVDVGDKVSQGTPIAELETAGGPRSRTDGRGRRRARKRSRRTAPTASTSSSSAPGPAATPPPSAPPTSASRSCSSSATSASAASASTSAASRPRRCCTSRR